MTQTASIETMASSQGEQTQDTALATATPLAVRDSRERWPVPRETLFERLRRYVLAFAFVTRPKRIATVPPLLARLTGYFLTPKSRRTLPSNEAFLPGDNCIVGFIHDTSPEGIMEGLRKGMHPNGHVRPFKWSAPRERCILTPEALRIEKNLSRLMRKEPFTLTFDRDPLGVVQGCAAPRKGRPPLTWITPDMQRVLMDLFDAGIMHTVEVCNEEGELVGGLFGYACDDLFMIQSQFHTVRDASKVATVGLMAHLTDWEFTGADGDFMTGYLQSFGFRNMSRGALAAMQTCRPTGPRVRWTFDESYDLGRWKPADGPCPHKGDNK